MSAAGHRKYPIQVAEPGPENELVTISVEDARELYGSGINFSDGGIVQVRRSVLEKYAPHLLDKEAT